MLSRELKLRELGALRPSAQRKRIAKRSYSSLCLSSYGDVASSHDAPITCMDIDSKNQRLLLSVDLHGKIAIHNLEKQELGAMEKLSPVKQAHVSHSALRSCQWYPPDPGVFVCAGVDGRMKIWAAGSPMRIIDEFKLGFPIRQTRMSTCPSASASLIAVCGESPIVRVCDMLSGGTAHSLIGHTKSVNTVAWNPVKQFCLVTGSSDGTIRSWDLRRPKGSLHVFDKQKTSPDPENNPDGSRKRKRQTSPSSSSRTPRRAHAGAVTHIKFTAKGDKLLSTGGDGRMRRWDVESGCNSMVHYSTANVSAILRIDVSLYDQYIAYPEKHQVRIFEAHSGKTMRTLQGHFDPVLCCTFRDSCQELYSAGADHSILRWVPKSMEDEAKSVSLERVKQQRSAAAAADRGAGGNPSSADYYHTGMRSRGEYDGYYGEPDWLDAWTSSDDDAVGA